MSKLYDYLNDQKDLQKDFTIEEFDVKKLQKKCIILCQKDYYNDLVNYQTIYVRVPNDTSRHEKLKLFREKLMYLTHNYIKFEGSVINLVWDMKLTQSQLIMSKEETIKAIEYEVRFKYEEVPL
ncbi:MAG: hypothetical protein EHM25_02525 [Nitrosopumilales archaeon]|nr:MAG: hypothetical protein EHM25_12580 [Nitrosopumilales archaeon]RPJ31528.1 MAG: hypothetical protein EHM25_02525 [Nitrosopumilales archaeon]